ncbi:caspase domain-containing protein [Xylaria sp. FL0933]|nr:caspase domain-containing protein [Xylaria sp. FL0933]
MSYYGYPGGYAPPQQQQPQHPGNYYHPPAPQGYNGYPQQGHTPQQYGYSQPPPPQQPYYSQGPPPQQHGGYNNNPSQYGRIPSRSEMPTVNSNSYNHGNYSAPPPPPSGPQHFGHGAPQNYAFQYSNCTGRRKALLIGINYFGQRGQLRGCINDVRNMSSYLVEQYGYKREDMVILTDDQQNPMSQPTKQNLLRAMHWLVKDARPNDSLFFHYSGHGGQTKDLDGDEPDGYDEVIYPVDFRQVGHITDDEMHRIMVRPLQAGVRLTAIFDSCHSGTALDLPYIYSTQGVLKEPNLAKEAGQGLLGVISSYSQGDLGGVANNIMGFFKKATGGEDAHNRAMATKTSAADVIMLSGSKDDQTSFVYPFSTLQQPPSLDTVPVSSQPPIHSLHNIPVWALHYDRSREGQMFMTGYEDMADATIAAQATGAMSWAFITALKKKPQQSYVQLLNSIRDELATRYTQKPQLSCSHPLSKQPDPMVPGTPNMLTFSTRHQPAVRHVK